MSYIVFARKYRPQSFDDIVGQSHITTTLKNAISQERIGHAYIFAGPRGVGKTTTARILAKALNCEKGPKPEPCNQCAPCREISAGTSLDILEIDGASNRGIDEIRNLRENVKFAPSGGRFRVYIIDEVHMLTSEAFNALLKTLEEPPAHAKFIFATTQAHKVPPTILSRCQRFDFRRISTRDAFENLKSIAKREGLDARDDALLLIAKHANGSMRDGQVILDQIASFSSGRIEAENVSKMLGIVEDDVIVGLSAAIKAKDAPAALKIIDRVISEGKDTLQLILGLIEHFRNLSVAKVSKDLDSLIDAGPEKIKYYEETAKIYTIEEMLRIIYTLSNAIDFMRKTNLGRIPLEAAVIKLARAGSVVSLDEIAERLDRLVHSPQSIVHSSTRIAKDEKPVNPAPEAAEKRDTPAEIDEILSSWTAVINYIMPKKISAASYLQEGYPVGLEGRVLTIGFPTELKFHKEALDSPESRRLIEEAVREVLKLDLRVVLTVAEAVDIKRAPEPAEPRQNGAGPEAEPDAAKDEPAKREVEAIVKAALDIFGGDIAGEGRGKGGFR